MLTLAAVQMPLSWREVSQLVSTWTHHLLFKRALLCLFAAVYEEIEVLRRSGGRRLLSRGARDELIGAVVLISCPIV